MTKGETISPQDDSNEADTSTEVDLKNILVLRDYCIRSLGSSCERCIVACPHEAISLTETELPLIDSSRCSLCGICFGVCDALVSTRITMVDLHAKISRIALRGEDVVLTCKENVFPGLEPAANVVVLPCFATLSPEFWTLLLAENISLSLAGDLSYCTDCQRAGNMGELLYSHAIQTAESWTGCVVGYQETIPEKESLLKDFANPQSVDRRSAFTNLVNDASDVASGKRRLRNSEVLQEFYERRERARARARLNLKEGPQLNSYERTGRTKQIMWPKRRLLLEAIDRKPEIAQEIPLLFAQTDYELCMNLLSCVDVCPSKARFPHSHDGSISFDARYCIGCGLCVDVCEKNAITLVEYPASILIDSNTEPQ